MVGVKGGRGERNLILTTYGDAPASLASLELLDFVTVRNYSTHPKMKRSDAADVIAHRRHPKDQTTLGSHHVRSMERVAHVRRSVTITSNLEVRTKLYTYAQSPYLS